MHSSVLECSRHNEGKGVCAKVDFHSNKSASSLGDICFIRELTKRSNATFNQSLRIEGPLSRRLVSKALQTLSTTIPIGPCTTNHKQQRRHGRTAPSSASQSTLVDGVVDATAFHSTDLRPSLSADSLEDASA